MSSLVCRSIYILLPIRPCCYNQLTAGDIIQISVLAEAVIPNIDKVFVHGGGFTWSGYLTARLPEEADPGVVLPMQALDADLLRRKPGPLDATVCAPPQIDGDPTIDLYKHPGVGLPKLFCEATGYYFQGS